MRVFWNQEYVNHNITNVGYTYSNTINNVTHSSVIDHFLCNDRLFNAVTEANVIHSVDNFSGHLSIYCKFSLNNLDPEVEANPNRVKPSWHKASVFQRSEFKETLNEHLSSILVPATCLDCNSLKCYHHDEVIEDFSMNICEAVDTAARNCLPSVGGGDNPDQGELSPVGTNLSNLTAMKVYFGTVFVKQPVHQFRVNCLFFLEMQDG